MRLSLIIVALAKLAGIALAVCGGSLGWALLLFFGPDVWLLYHVFVPGASGLVRTFTRFETNRPEVWLTLDDGPDPDDTPRILDLLDRHDARATFFLIGERAARHPELVAEIARRGHEIGHHTHTHRTGTFWCATPARTRRELDAALPHLTPAGTRPPTRFRAPVGIKNLFLGPALAERHLTCVGWNVRSLDSLSRDSEKPVTRVLRQVRPGSILLMHEGPSLHEAVRVAALARMVEQLTARGFLCVIPTDEQLR